MVLIDQNKIDWCWLWFVWPVLVVQMTGVMVCVACVGGSDDWCYGLCGLCWWFR